MNETKLNVDATVFVVDDDDALRDSLVLLVRSAGLRAESYASAESFLSAYNAAKPGCLLLDLRMPAMSGLELQDVLKTRGIGLPIVFISGHADVPDTSKAMRAGALDVIEKPFSSEYLAKRVREALERDARLRRVERRRRVFAERFTALTVREYEVMTRLVEGKFVKEIAVELKLSPNTIQIHRTRIFRKTQVDSVAKLIWLAFAAGIRDARNMPEEL